MKSIFLIVAIISAQTFAHEHHNHKSMEMKAKKPISGASIYNLKEKWSDQEGKLIQLQDLVGKKVVLAMVYLGCKSACPVLTADMKAIARKLPAGETDKVRFVLASIDPKRDSIAQLKAFSEKNKLGPNWTLLTGTDRSVRELAAALGVQYKQEKNGEFQHSNTITLLDDQGLVKVQIQGLGSDHAELLSSLR